MGDVLHRAMSFPELLSLFRCPSRTLKTPLMDRPARREGHGSTRLRSYRDACLSGRRYTHLWT